MEDFGQVGVPCYSSNELQRSGCYDPTTPHTHLVKRCTSLCSLTLRLGGKGGARGLALARRYEERNRLVRLGLSG